MFEIETIPNIALLRYNSSRKIHDRFILKCLICDNVMDDFGMKCSKCFRSSCISCIKLILNQIKTSDYDQWCHVVNRYISDMIVPSNFIGHCYEINYFSKGSMSIQDVSSKKIRWWVVSSTIDAIN